eukprot:scaffold5256_cov126-Isochrysis_galbana.AAC.3
MISATSLINNHAAAPKPSQKWPERMGRRPRPRRMPARGAAWAAWMLAAGLWRGSGASEMSQQLAFEQMRLAAQLSRGHSRRDFRPCSGEWNLTMATEHEASFMLCVAGDEHFETPDVRIAHELLPGGSQPLSAVSEGLMLSESQRFCNCTRELHNAASCGHASAQAILDEYEPWCFVLDACPAVARALLHSAQTCQAAGMRGDNHSALCVAAGANECASRVESLFDATHAMHGWVNDTAARLEDLRRLRSRWHGLWAVLPSWLAPAEREGASFDQLSGCLGSVGVEESQLHLPMPLVALSGNGSFTEYAAFFRARCGVDYQLWAGLVDSMVGSALSLSGMEYAQVRGPDLVSAMGSSHRGGGVCTPRRGDFKLPLGSLHRIGRTRPFTPGHRHSPQPTPRQHRTPPSPRMRRIGPPGRTRRTALGAQTPAPQLVSPPTCPSQDEWALGHHLTALGVLGANMLVLCLACGAMVRLVRRGHCYRACSPSSREERRGLKGDNEGRGSGWGSASNGVQQQPTLQAVELERA